MIKDFKKEIKLLSKYEMGVLDGKKMGTMTGNPRKGKRLIKMWLTEEEFNKLKSWISLGFIGPEGFIVNEVGKRGDIIWN